MCVSTRRRKCAAKSPAVDIFRSSRRGNVDDSDLLRSSADWRSGRVMTILVLMSGPGLARWRGVCGWTCMGSFCSQRPSNQHTIVAADTTHITTPQKRGKTMATAISGACSPIAVIFALALGAALSQLSLDIFRRCQA